MSTQKARTQAQRVERRLRKAYPTSEGYSIAVYADDVSIILHARYDRDNVSAEVTLYTGDLQTVQDLVQEFSARIDALATEVAERVVAEELRHAALPVLAFFGHPAGREAGGFVTALIIALSRADRENRAKLATVYPAYTEAYEMGSSVSDGLDQLARRAAL